MSIYADSTFFVSHYLQDSHASEVDRLMVARPRVWLTPFQRVELFHALYQHVFRGALGLNEVQRMLRNFQLDCEQGIWELVDQPATLYSTCERLARQHVATLGVRTLDSLHVAAALELGATRFWTFDQRQARLAEAEGLVTAQGLATFS